MMVHTPILPAVRKLKQEKSKFEARRGYKNEILSKQKKKNYQRWPLALFDSGMDTV